MKIAICLSGHMRKFNAAFATLNLNVLQKYNCDIFIHTWDKMGYNSNYKTDITLDDTSKYLNQIKIIYKPKKMIVEESSFVEELKKQSDCYAPHLRNEPKHVGHMASMFYKIFACNELRKSYQLETGTKYDWVIRCRPDLIFHTPVILPLDKMPNKVYISKQQSHSGWINDQFAIGLPEDIDLYSSFFFHMEEYFLARNEFYPEKFMHWSMKKKNLIPEMWDLHFSILR